jgi:O-antigen ligase
LTNLSITSLSQQTGRSAAIVLGVAIPISPAADAVLVVLLILAWLAGGSLREKVAAVRESPAALGALAFLGLLVLGTAWGEGTLRESWYYLRKYQDLILVALLAGIVASERDRLLAMAAFMAAMALTLVLSYAQWLAGEENPVPFKAHIAQGTMMALAAFFAGVQALRETQPRWRLAWAAGALLAMYNVLFMLQSRTGYLVLGVLALYFCVAHWRWRGIAAAAAAGAITLAAAYAVNAPLVTSSLKARGEVRDWEKGAVGAAVDETSMGIRMSYYRTAIAIMREHPLSGVGTGGYVRAYQARAKPHPAQVPNNPHNQYLLTGVQLGVGGLLAVVALFGVMWWHAGRLEPTTRIAARGLVAAIAAGCLFNSFLIDHTEGLLFAWMAGVLFAPPRRVA